MVNLRGLSTLQSCGPHSLSAANYGPVSSFSPLACAEKKAAAVGEEEVVSGELLRAHYAVLPFQILSHGHLSAHAQVVICQSPQVMLLM